MEGSLPFEMKQPRYNAETEAAMQEARDIVSGKKKSKKYSSADELFTELDAEYEAEYGDNLFIKQGNGLWILP